MGNYVIRRQADGEVYLAHAGTASAPKTERPGHKYILRLLTSAGTRYFYTPEQVRAFYNSVKGKAKDPLGIKAQQEQMKKGLNVITKRGQESTAKWKFDRKPTAENANNYERAKAKSNYAQRDYYEARKAADKTIVGKLSSALRPKPSSDSQKSDQNGRSRGQSNMYVTDKYGNTYRPGVISDKPKGGMQSAVSGKNQKASGNNTAEAANKEYHDALSSGDPKKIKDAAAKLVQVLNNQYANEQSEAANREYHDALASGDPQKIKDAAAKLVQALNNEVANERKQKADGATKDMPQGNDKKDNRPEGRKRNVTGKAEPIEKGEGLGISVDDHANRANPDRNGAKAQEAIDQYVDKRSLLKDVEKRINTLSNKDGIKPNENRELSELQKEKEKLEKECIGLLQDFHRYSAMSSDDAIANSIRKSSVKS